MKDFLRELWHGLGNERTQRWVLPPYAAVCLVMAMAGTTGWRWWHLAFGVAYAFAAGWLWAKWARRRDMKRRNAIVVESLDPAASRAAAEYLEWFANEWKAGRR